MALNAYSNYFTIGDKSYYYIPNTYFSSQAKYLENLGNLPASSRESNMQLLLNSIPENIKSQYVYQQQSQPQVPIEPVVVEQPTQTQQPIVIQSQQNMLNGYAYEGSLPSNYYEVQDGTANFYSQMRNRTETRRVNGQTVRTNVNYYDPADLVDTFILSDNKWVDDDIFYGDYTKPTYLRTGAVPIRFYEDNTPYQQTVSSLGLQPISERVGSNMMLKGFFSPSQNRYYTAMEVANLPDYLRFVDIGIEEGNRRREEERRAAEQARIEATAAQANLSDVERAENYLEAVGLPGFTPAQQSTSNNIMGGSLTAPPLSEQLIAPTNVPISVLSPSDTGFNTLQGLADNVAAATGRPSIDTGAITAGFIRQENLIEQMNKPIEEETTGPEVEVILNDPNLIAIQDAFNQQTASGATPIFNSDSTISFMQTPLEATRENFGTNLNNIFSNASLNPIQRGLETVKLTVQTAARQQENTFLIGSLGRTASSFADTLVTPFQHPVETVRGTISAAGTLLTTVNPFTTRENRIAAVGTIAGTTRSAVSSAIRDPFAAAGSVAGLWVGGKIIGAAGDFVLTKAKNVYVRAGSKQVPVESVVSPKVLSGQETMPLSKGTSYALKEFNKAVDIETGKISVSTASQAKITGGVVKSGTKIGLEDSGIYVTPKGQTSSYFLGLDDGYNYQYSMNPFKNTFKLPTVTEFSINKVTTYPKSVLKQPGFTAVEQYQMGNIGKGQAYITKRSMIGQGELKAQKFIAPSNVNTGNLKVKAGQVRVEAGTSELEAVIGKGELFKYTPKTTIGKVKGFDEYFMFKGKAVPLRQAEVLTSRSATSASSRVFSGSTLASEQKALSSYLGSTRYVTPASALKYSVFASSSAAPKLSSVSILTPSVSYRPTTSYSSTSYRPSTSILSSSRSSTSYRPSSRVTPSSSVTSFSVPTISSAPLSSSSYTSSSNVVPSSSSISSQSSILFSPIPSIASATSSSSYAESSNIVPSSSSISSQQSIISSPVSSVVSSPTSSIISTPSSSTSYSSSSRSYAPSSILSFPSSSIVSVSSSSITSTPSSSRSYGSSSRITSSIRSGSSTSSTPVTPILPPATPPKKKKKIKFLGEEDKTKKKKRAKTKSFYSPSVEAIVYNKKGKRPKLSSITGLELRPL